MDFIPYDKNSKPTEGYHWVKTESGREVFAFYTEGNWAIPDVDEKITHIEK